MELKSISDIQGNVIELQSAILTAQSSALAENADQFSMVEEIRVLRERVESLTRCGYNSSLSEFQCNPISHFMNALLPLNATDRAD